MMRENDKRNMIITIDGSYLDDRLRTKLEFEGAGFGYSPRLKTDLVYEARKKPTYLIFSNSSQSLLNNSISLEALMCVNKTIGQIENRVDADFVKAVVGFYAYSSIEYALENHLDFPNCKFLIERERGTNNRIYHKGDSSMLKSIGVKIRIPGPSRRGAWH